MDQKMFQGGSAPDSSRVSVFAEIFDQLRGSVHECAVFFRDKRSESGKQQQEYNKQKANMASPTLNQMGCCHTRTS
ncbi:hypothetical protein LQV63_01490 [Paenibacillus profundus]|uniref:LXG domain-containing protein n=1 Tax=Paenibacillus profundus TaxID=1173085 RepID=A0ABS8YCA8_9BACL|nr:hypothetical protein [Paenibacillus profundus]